MSEVMVQEGQRASPGEEGEIVLADYWRVIWRYKWLTCLLCAASVSGALIFGLLSPKIYEATATILIPKEGAGGGLLSAIGATGLSQQLAGISIPSLTPNRDTFISLLKSRSIAERMVEQFKLQAYYKAAHLEDAIRTLKGVTKITLSKEGVIEVMVEDTDPKMAADLANAYLSHLDRLTGRLGTGTASNHRRFISEQLIKTEGDLKVAEDNLRQFHERNRAFLLGDMVNSMRLPGAQVPKVQIELARLGRDLKVQEAVYTLLIQQLEQAKLGEAQDVPVVQVLDRAVPPLYRSKPRIRVNMALAGAASLVMGVLLSFLLDAFKGRRHAAQRRP